MSEPWDLFADVADITAWLDTANPRTPHEDSMRVLKLVEEAGEAAAAYIGMVGQNPRKGVTHTWQDVEAELCDVMFTAMVALTTLTPDARKIFDTHLARVADRSLQKPR